MRRNLTRALRLSMIVAATAGCATPARIPPERAAEIDPERGLVIGSVRVHVDPSLPDRSRAYAPGRDSAGMTHALVIDCTTRFESTFGFSSVTVLPIALGEELILVQKLPARTCELTHRAEGGTGFVVGPVSSSIGKIGVQPGGAIYFGAIDFALPTVLAVGSIGRSTVADDKVRTFETLRPDYGALLDGARYRPALASAGPCCAAEELGFPGSEPAPRPEPLSWLAGEWNLRVFEIGAASVSPRPDFGRVRVAAPSDGSVSISASAKGFGDFSLRLTRALGSNEFLLDVERTNGIHVESFPVTYVEGAGWNGKRDQLLDGRTQSVTASLTPVEAETSYGWVIEVLPTAAAQLSSEDRMKRLETPYLKADLTRPK
jgi:hypothetical protein